MLNYTSEVVIYQFIFADCERKIIMFKNKKLNQLDKEFMRRFEAFAFDEVVNEKGQQLEDKTRYMVILASLIGSQSKELYEDVLLEVINSSLDPIVIKEIVYQSVDYIGMGKAYPFLNITNKVMEKLNIELPLKDQTKSKMENRLKKGIDIQVKVFGENMKEFWKGGHINRWLAANCFGDYYTRSGLDLKERELITFCFLLSQGGCESQLKSHIFGNLNIGNSKELLIKVISQCLPYIGYPRSLNGITCINEICENN